MPRAFGCLGLLAVAASVAHAQPQPQTAAQRLEAAGLAAGQRGDYDAAIKAFAGAFAADPQPRFRCNLGTAYYGRADFAGRGAKPPAKSKNSDYQRAQLYLGWCLDRIATAPAGMAKVAQFVETKLREAGLVRVQVTTRPANAMVSIANLGTLASPVTVFLAAGEHTLSVRHDGHRPTSETFVLTGGQDRNVSATLEAIAPEPEPEPDPKPAVEPEPRIVSPPIEVAPLQSRWRRTPAYVIGGAAVVGLAVGIGFRLHAGDIVSERITGQNLGPGDEYDDAKSDAQRSYYIGLSGFAVAGVAAAVSTYLFARPEKRGRLSAGARPTRGGAFVGVSLSL